MANIRRQMEIIGQFNKATTEEEIENIKTQSEYLENSIRKNFENKESENFNEEIVIETTTKGKTIQPKLELHQDEEYTEETVKGIHDYLEKKYGKKREYTFDELFSDEFADQTRKTVEETDKLRNEPEGNFLRNMEDELLNRRFEQKSPVDEKEIRLWNEDVENIEKDIKIPPDSLSSMSGSDSSSETTEEESEVGNINTNWIHFGFEDFDLTNLFEEPVQQQPETMALDIIKVKDFYGKPDEDVNEWVRDFNRAAEVNRWTNDDADNNLRLGMAKAHLKGEAADWCETNDANLTRWSNGDAGHQMSLLIVAEFNTPER